MSDTWQIDKVVYASGRVEYRVILNGTPYMTDVGYASVIAAPLVCKSLREAKKKIRQIKKWRTDTTVAARTRMSADE